MSKKISVFETLSKINVNEHTEKKAGLTYLSWAWAWAEVKKHFPDSFYTIYENSTGLNYHHDNKTAWVKTGVTIEGQELIEMLPVMNYRNQSIPVDSLTSFDVNKSIQRSLTKAIARHGLGLYIYAGEDLPEEETENKTQHKKTIPAKKPVKEGPKDVKKETVKETFPDAKQQEVFDKTNVPEGPCTLEIDAKKWTGTVSMGSFIFDSGAERSLKDCPENAQFIVQ